GKIFDENFLMTAATAGAFAIGEFPEAAAVMLFYQAGEFFQSMAVSKSKKSISALMGLRPDYANVIRDGVFIQAAPETVAVGDYFVVRPGEKIPLDGIIAEGVTTLDMSALTGESAPKRAAVSDAVLSGSVNISGVLLVEAVKPYGESTAAKIIALVENAAGRKAPAEKFITRFARIYTPAVVGLALLLAVIPPLLLDLQWTEWIRRALVFLVISCPCALVISIPLGYFGGIGCAARRGVLVKGGNFLDALNNLDIAVFDKTGTLTKGTFKVTGLHPANGFKEKELLELAANAEAFSCHPVAQPILAAYSGEPERIALKEYEEMAGRGVRTKLHEKIILAGNEKLMEDYNVAYEKNNEAGSCVYVSINGTFAGSIIISDEIKPDAKKAVSELKTRGVKKIVMLTGDKKKAAEAAAKELGIDEFHAGLLPHEKVALLEDLAGQKRKNGYIAFAGDGINDAPVLARADVGIAMGAFGSDAAIEAADIVLMTDELGKLTEAMDAARFTRKIVWQNIALAMGVKGLFLVLGALGAASLWEAVFADVGVALLAVLNAARAVKKNNFNLTEAKACQRRSLSP
ncbi:MAG: cadmium-translocating P-type ATPase, partial [Defluviitaleaceae bacterium]|nr:cadmium-translocating P-type ATPase [Defluviitaleaceae bacterium]